MKTPTERHIPNEDFITMRPERFRQWQEEMNRKCREPKRTDARINNPGQNARSGA